MYTRKTFPHKICDVVIYKTNQQTPCMYVVGFVIHKVVEDTYFTLLPGDG